MPFIRIIDNQIHFRLRHHNIMSIYFGDIEGGIFNAIAYCVPRYTNVNGRIKCWQRNQMQIFHAKLILFPQVAHLDGRHMLFPSA